MVIELWKDNPYKAVNGQLPYVVADTTRSLTMQLRAWSQPGCFGFVTSSTSSGDRPPISVRADLTTGDGGVIISPVPMMVAPMMQEAASAIQA